MRKVSMALVATAAIVASASPAFAAQPTRVFSSASSFVVPSSAAGGPCSFAMNVSVDVDREYVTTFFDQTGDVVRLQIAGHLVQTIFAFNVLPSAGREVDLCQILGA